MASTHRKAMTMAAQNDDLLVEEEALEELDVAEATEDLEEEQTAESEETSNEDTAADEDTEADATLTDDEIAERKAARAERRAAALDALKKARDAEFQNARELAEEFTGFIKREVPATVDKARKTGGDLVGGAQTRAAQVAAAITDRFAKRQDEPDEDADMVEDAQIDEEVAPVEYVEIVEETVVTEEAIEAEEADDIEAEAEKFVEEATE